jgi:hypothetical protein
MQKIIGFLCNAMGLLFYKCMEDPYTAAKILFREINPAVQFTFDNSKYDTTDAARVFKRELLIELRHLIDEELKASEVGYEIKS